MQYETIQRSFRDIIEKLKTATYLGCYEMFEVTTKHVVHTIDELLEHLF